jgi:hypothetical protein
MTMMLRAATAGRRGGDDFPNTTNDNRAGDGRDELEQVRGPASPGTSTTSFVVAFLAVPQLVVGVLPQGYTEPVHRTGARDHDTGRQERNA